MILKCPFSDGKVTCQLAIYPPTSGQNIWNDFFCYSEKYTLKNIFTLLLLLFCANIFAQQREANMITAVYDTSALPELYDKLPIGLYIAYTNKEVVETEGYLRGNYRWSRVKVVPDNGKFQDGYLLLDRQTLVNRDYKVVLTVTIPEAPQSIITSITLPRLDSIRFNHYADSIKRGVHFYLNVEGIFSSGKIFPLSTDAVRLEATDGKLIGQDLLINTTDNWIQSVNVTATYKYDESKQALSTLPVKQKISDQ